MKILGIESSCDDTSVALIEANEKNFTILAEKTASQIDVHKKYGGVVPEVAARCHAEAIVPVIEEVMQGQDKPDVIAVTSGPGLITSLLVGVEAAKTLTHLWDVPLIGVNHIEGHIHSVEIPTMNNEQLTINNKIEFPALCLVVSGGHSELVLMESRGDYKRIGYTRDDAAGECFDKAAKLLGYEYPGGPKISKFAALGNPTAIQFPRPMLKENNYDFSFAGLKTAALYWLRDHDWVGDKRQEISDKKISDFCASFEQAIVDVLVTKTLRAAEEYKPKSILLVGGVSANKKLRDTLGEALKKQYPSISYLLSPLKYAMDNGAMIAVAGYYHAVNKKFNDWRTLEADPGWEIDMKK
jgi:N6-L-threonylcarbamoyladenine synthase